ncbi:MAG TPA: hypothetical protein VN598_11900 [Usitatibacter sp.]|nr:hypothetical protein [Usitatibacter sp.]
MIPPLAFEAYRRNLYTAEELFRCFDPSHPESYANSYDVSIYREFISLGGSATTDFFAASSRAVHDCCISQLLARAIYEKRVTAIMGGHGALRGDPNYVAAANIAARLAAKDHIVVSGGGPGAMEAVHLGASFAADIKSLAEAIDQLRRGPLSIPKNASRLVKPDGSIDRDIARKLGEFLAPALSIRRSHGTGGGLGIPTWMYGHEPTTPLADGIAKYFQNSIREDGMLALATHGIVFVAGGAGTAQEIFQDAAQNYYHTFPAGPAGAGYFSPMVFYGDFWTKTVDVQTPLRQLFSNGQPPVPAEFQERVRFTSDIEEAVEFVERFIPPSKNRTVSMLAEK